MRTKLVNEHAGQRTYVVVLDTGDEVVASLREVAVLEGLTAAQVSAIGALSDAVLGYFDWDEKDYRRIPVREQVEVVSMLGDIGVDEQDQPALHLHLVLGRRDGSAMGGHLLEAHVRPTLEVMLTESPAHLRRRKDEATGLALIRL
jgi:predicted DNA-binding protein with PD1-like motif